MGRQVLHLGTVAGKPFPLKPFNVKVRRMPKLKRSFSIFEGFYVFYTDIGSFVAPPLVKQEDLGDYRQVFTMGLRPALDFRISNVLLVDRTYAVKPDIEKEIKVNKNEEIRFGFYVPVYR